jgi:3',5'-cyclic AMP phosphodiesterase CpdA
MTLHFAQLSDPHLTSLEGVSATQLLNKRLLGYLSWRRRRRAEHRREVLQALEQDLQDLALTQLLVTGDLTHIGLPDEFRQAANWLRTLGTPEQVALVPGNHDACVRQDWQQGFGQWQDYLDSDTPGDRIFPSLRKRGEIAFIGLSTACPTLPLMASGTLGRQQLQALPALLEQCSGMFRVVYLHHSPLPGVDKWRKRLTDAESVSEILKEHGAELVLHGHGHRAQWHELQSVVGSMPVIAVPSASALGLHGADTAQYNRYSVCSTEGGWNLRVKTRCYRPEAGHFTDGQTRELLIARQ